MNGGLFIALYDKESLKLYLKNGLYGFLMRPEKQETMSAHSKHYAALADYACSREGTKVFFFLNRCIYYAGTIIGNKNTASFYINGTNSPLGIKSSANLFWDESDRYLKTDENGVFVVGESEKSQPFIIQFKKDENTGKYISSDDLYFELGKYPYPLPSNSMQGMGFCTLTPAEVSSLDRLITSTSETFDYSECDTTSKNGKELLFSSDLISVNDRFINEAQLEFTLLASLKPLESFIDINYIPCRQVPISPFKPMDMDRADICLFDNNRLINNGSVPNVVIELKRDYANYHAYNQVARYLKWLKMITDKKDFDCIRAFVVAKDFTRIKREKVDTSFVDKIKMYSLNRCEFVELD